MLDWTQPNSERMSIFGNVEEIRMLIGCDKMVSTAYIPLGYITACFTTDLNSAIKMSSCVNIGTL